MRYKTIKICFYSSVCIIKTRFFLSDHSECVSKNHQNLFVLNKINLNFQTIKNDKFCYCIRLKIENIVKKYKFFKSVIYIKKSAV